MKKCIAFISALIIAFSYVACTKVGDGVVSEESAMVSSEESFVDSSEETGESTLLESEETSDDASSEESESSESADVESSEDESSAEEPETTTPPTSSAPVVEESSKVTESSTIEYTSVAPNPGREEYNQSTAPNDPSGAWINPMINQQDRDYHGYSPEELDAYFNGAVFSGDSVFNGLKIYTQNNEDIFNGVIFNTGACYGFHNCLSPVSSSSMHPLYQGQKRTLWEMVSITGTDKIFIGFGLNDFGCTTRSSVIKCLDRIKANLYAANPNVEIILLSSGYFTKKGSSYNPSKNDYRTNNRQREYNQLVLDYCNANGWDYIDVTNCFSDQYGDLDASRSLDNYCHPKIGEYTVWRDILYSYAAAKLMGNYTNPPTMK